MANADWSRAGRRYYWSFNFNRPASYRQYVERAEVTTALSDIELIQLQIVRYIASGNAQPPANLRNVHEITSTLFVPYCPRLNDLNSLHRQGITPAFSAYSPSLDINGYAPYVDSQSETIILRYSCRTYSMHVP